jgi:hypothetical protein
VPRHARVIERPQETPEVRALPPNHDGEIPPRDAVLDVHASQLARDVRVLLGRMTCEPRIDADIGAAVHDAERHHRRRGALGEPPQRDVGRPLEGEDVCLRVAGHDEARGAERLEEPLSRERRVLQVVHEHVIEHRLAPLGDERRLPDEPAEVHRALGAEHVEVAGRSARVPTSRRDDASPLRPRRHLGEEVPPAPG